MKRMKWNYEIVLNMFFLGYIEQFEWLTEFLGQNLKIRFFSEMQYSQKDKKVKRCSNVYDAKVHISNLHFSQRFRNFNFGWFVALLAWHNFLKKLSPIAFLHLWQSNTRRKIIKRNTESILRYKILSDRDREPMDKLSVLLPD